MSKEPDSRNQPDEEKDDILGDEIEEIDLDALLADDALDTPLAGDTAPDPAPAKGDPEAYLESEVLDLTSDREEVDIISADDLLDIEDAPERPQPVRMDSATNGNPEDEELSSLDDSSGFASREEMPRSTMSSSEAEEDLSAFNLLDDDPSAGEPEEKPIDLLADDFSLTSPEAAVEVTESVEEETAVLAERAVSAADEGPDEAAAAMAGAGAGAAGAKKLGRGRGTKPLKAARKKGTEAEAAEAPLKAARSPKKKAKEKTVAEEKVVVAGASRSTGSIPFVCSECYEEFLISSSYPHEMVSCPECLHVGKKPDADFIRTIHLHKAGEKRSLLAAVACGTFLAIVALALVWMNAPGPGADKAPDGTTNMALLGVGGLLTLCLLWLVARFEGNRWEVYF